MTTTSTPQELEFEGSRPIRPLSEREREYLGGLTAFWLENEMAVMRRYGFLEGLQRSHNPERHPRKQLQRKD